MIDLVLDHGYVRFVEDWGIGDAKIAEAGIIEAARMSTNKAFQGWPNDEKLLAYLYNNKHMTPFEMAGMTLEIMLPIFVVREWHRHRTQSYNEMSARYIPMPNVHYVPSIQRLMVAQDSSNKQAQGLGAKVDAQKAEMYQTMLTAFYQSSQQAYEASLDIGVPKELARLFVSVGRYTKMRASANLRNWLAFMTLRLDPAAQWEIRQYAMAVRQVAMDRFPRTMSLFLKGQS